jgi:long-chain acyl-CoA synthetase
MGARAPRNVVRRPGYTRVRAIGWRVRSTWSKMRARSIVDVSNFLEVRPAPCAVFDRLEQRAERPRYRVRTQGGEWRAVTWAEHAAEIRDITLWLISRGHAAGQRGAIFGHNSVSWMSAALALESAGMVMVPIYPASTPEQAAYVLQHSGASVLFVGGSDLLARVFRAWRSLRGVEVVVVLDGTDPATVLADLEREGVELPSAVEVERKLVHLSQARSSGGGSEDVFDRALRAIDLDQPAIMLYTSGSTGNPKGVPLTHRNLGVNASDWLRCCGPGLPDDGVDLLWLPMSHIFGFGEASFGNTLGWTSYLADPSTVLGLLPKVRPNVFMSVPAFWTKIAESALAAGDVAAQRRAIEEATGGRLQFCLSGGAGLERAVKEVYQRAGVLLLEGYGLTETSPTLTINRPDDFRFDTVGKPVPSIEIRLADDGEILARGPSVFGGYHDAPEATAEAFTDDGWFKTGDVGRFTDEGFLQIVDRKKEILVTAGGKNVPPANIERQFDGDPLFDRVIVYGDGKKYLVAGVWVNASEAKRRLEQHGGTLEELVQQSIDAANDKLARFEQIKRFGIMQPPLTVEAGLLTSTLKIRRKQIYAAFADAFEDLYR